MNKKQVIGIMAVSLASVAVVSGCTTDSNGTNVKKFTEKEQKEYMKKFSDKVVNAKNVNEIIEELDKNIDKVSKNEASTMVDGLLFVMHKNYTDMNNKIYGLQAELAELDKKGIDYNKTSDILKVEDAMTKAFLQEAIAQKYNIQKIGSEYYVKPNIKWVLDKYGKYMNEDLKAITEFTLEETTKAFYNADTQSFDLDTVVSRILKIEENMKKFPDSFYLESMKNSKEYYYQIYFGVNNQFLVDNNKKVKDSVLKHYQKTVEKYPNTQIGKDTKAVLEKLKTTNNVVTDDLFVYLLDLTGTAVDEVQKEAKATEEKANKIVEESKEKTDKTKDSPTSEDSKSVNSK